MPTEVWEWAASLSGMAAALMISLNLGRRITGFGFLIFVASSVCWIVAAALESEPALGSQNAVLFVINCVGVYRWLIRDRGATPRSQAGPGPDIKSALPPG